MVFNKTLIWWRDQKVDTTVSTVTTQTTHSRTDSEELPKDSPSRPFREVGSLAEFWDFILLSRVFLFSFAGSLLATLVVLVTFFSVTRTRTLKLGGGQRLGSDDSITYSPIKPPSYPLAVRNPYLSTWIPGNLVEDLPSSSPQFWAGQNLGWRIIARVDNRTFNLMGVQNPENGSQSATVLAAEYTSTHSIFTLSANGSGTFTLDFFSPVSPSNYLRQSLPFSYLTVTASSSVARSIQVYSDIDNTWTGQASGTEWNLTTSGETSVFSMSIANAYTFAQNPMDQALWGSTIFASRHSNSSSLTVQAGDRVTARQSFLNSGKLSGKVVDWTQGSVVALSHDLGSVSQETPVTFAVGHVREEAINYLGTAYTGYYRATYPNTVDAVSHFLDDYQEAAAESQSLDLEVSTKSTEVAGTNYSNIVTLSMTQAYGGIDLVIENDTLDPNSVMAFIKEISSDGNVNTLDIIFPAFPIYFVMEPEYIRLLLEPVLKYLATGRWNQSYTIHDIGSNYPNATGHNDQKAESMPIEESGNLLTLAYAYTIATGNTTWASQYTSIFQKYADYLAGNSINIALQLSTNDAAGPLTNETNLAIKAAVGLKAFGAMTGLTNYSDIGSSHANLLYNNGLAMDTNKTHLLLQYPAPAASTTWKVPFNLFPDILLNLTTFPSSLYTAQSTYYPTITSPSGTALDNRQWWGKTDWNVWVAGTCDDVQVRDMFIDDIWGFVSNGLNEWPFSDRWVVRGKGDEGDEAPKGVGTEFALRARPTVGGHFALLALKGARFLKW